TSAVEFQMLFGMAEPMKAAVSSMGYRLRDYVPIGEMIPGMAYLVRRLLENTSNESWLRMSFVDGASIEVLLAQPGPPSDQDKSRSEPAATYPPLTEHGFRNEPMRDFAEQSHRLAMARAIKEVQGKLDKTYPLVIGGRSITTARTLTSHYPGDPQISVGTVHIGDQSEAQAAINAARAAQAQWSARPAKERAQFLMETARQMRLRRDELAAWMVWEVGKTWREADGDVCEAIDFCDYYAREMVRLASPQRLGHIPGELNLLMYKSRGVAAVIAPWNFPLAILTGMVMAAAVTGNTVIMKPAEQSPIIAAKLMECITAAGFPAGVINFLPGYGHEVGKYLTHSAEVAIVAFTGSMEVGLEILRVAGQTQAGQTDVKKVICEMGGKNAIIVDADADLDEAVQGVVQSAFGFQGQKCSACSRVIVHESCYEEFRRRVVEATASLVIGPPHDPATRIGPVVDAEAQQKIQSYVDIGRREGKLLIQRDVPAQGYFVGPAVFDELSPDARLAQEEIFGPVLAILKAADFDEALEIANATRFALTGGIYSRSPHNIDKARERFNVGNLYINRGITGALVYRNPFGGFKMSGSGTKAGSPDYLLQFMEPRSITENTMRRGFAPIE
ncbi:MAG: L-glutamate gamma-semialdehyde dehydrogenase, partial [Bradymonadaceae bacterium]